MRILSRRALPLFIVAALLSLFSACGSDASQPLTGDVPARKADAQHQQQHWHMPSHHITGRTVTVSLPYKGHAQMLWLAAQRDEDIAPFTLQSIDHGPLQGDREYGVTTYVYTSPQAASAVLRFALIPAGKTLFGPAETRFESKPSRNYTATVTVP